MGGIMAQSDFLAENLKQKVMVFMILTHGYPAIARISTFEMRNEGCKASECSASILHSGYVLLRKSRYLLRNGVGGSLDLRINPGFFISLSRGGLIIIPARR